MTREEIDILLSEPVRLAVEHNIANDPVRIALNKNIPYAGLVASQVKYLGRARTKLPSYYAARCVIPPLAFEQASSELTAQNKRYSGDLCIDLTCGLGVDSLAFSSKFGKVVAVERDPDLAYLAQCNFELLGAGNIRVVNMSAEDFIAANPNLKPDLIYADPDRRSDTGRKLVRLEDCRPDIVRLLPDLRRMSDRIVVKMSPLFDVDEAFRVFGEHTRVEVVSLDGECKEVLAQTGSGITEYSIVASVIGLGEVEYSGRKEPIAEIPMPENPEYLIVPDVALAKARIAKRYFTEAGFAIESDNSYAFGVGLPPENLPGRAYRITCLKPYSPAKLKKELKGVGRIDILKRNFPYSAADIARQLGVAEGGATKIAFTRCAGSPLAIFITLL